MQTCPRVAQGLLKLAMFVAQDCITYNPEPGDFPGRSCNKLRPWTASQLFLAYSVWQYARAPRSLYTLVFRNQLAHQHRQVCLTTLHDLEATCPLHEVFRVSR